MMTKIKILHLEDSLRDSELIRSILKDGDISFDYFLAENEHELITVLKAEHIDIIQFINAIKILGQYWAVINKVPVVTKDVFRF